MSKSALLISVLIFLRFDSVQYKVYIVETTGDVHGAVPEGAQQAGHSTAGGAGRGPRHTGDRAVQFINMQCSAMLVMLQGGDSVSRRAVLESRVARYTGLRSHCLQPNCLYRGNVSGGNLTKYAHTCILPPLKTIYRFFKLFIYYSKLEF